MKFTYADRALFVHELQPVLIPSTELHTHRGRVHTHTHTHTHTVNGKNRALVKGSLNVLDLVRCSVKTKACSNTVLGAFLQCKGQTKRSTSCIPAAFRYSLWQRR